MIDHTFKIECEEDGLYLAVSAPGYLETIYRIPDPEQFYDHVKGAIGPWLRERDEARAAMPELPGDVSGAYDLSDPKHPEHHSVHADIWDAREGK